MPTVKVGCDPELFVRNRETGNFVSAHDLIPGTKSKPFPVELGAVQVDGVAAEFNITPATSPREFLRNVKAVKGQLEKMIGPKYELVSVPFAKFEKEYFASLPDSVRELGCNPDFCAWNNTPNPPPDPSGDLWSVRTASGHIHVGWTDNEDPTSPHHVSDCNLVVKQMDYFLGLPSLMWDRDNTRRNLYGKAGACRYKPYGVEYRVLSNKWLESDDLILYVFQQTSAAINSLFQGVKPIQEIIRQSPEELINQSKLWWSLNENKQFYTNMTNNIQFPQAKYYQAERVVTPKPEKQSKADEVWDDLAARVARVA